jgi:glycosyltransferase involved in cell wall biosynthesis
MEVNCQVTGGHGEAGNNSETHGRDVSRADSMPPEKGGAPVRRKPSLVIASIHREEGITGVHTHIRQFRQYLDKVKMDATVVTSFSWKRVLTYPVFGLRKPIRACSRPASVLWFRHWHEVFLYHALRRRLAELNECVIYAHEPLAARAALRARRGPSQRVVLAIHYSTSTSEEWVVTEGIKPGGPVYRKIRRDERQIIPQVDGIVYVSRWTRHALLDWLPEAETVPSEVIFNFVAPLDVAQSAPESAGDLVTVGSLVDVKNHSYLLDVLVEAKKSGQVLTLDIFGEGPLRSDLERKISALGLDDQVRLRGFRTDVRTFLPGYRAYVHSCYSESFCLAIVEAMGAGLPVVAGNVGAISELFDNGVEGRFWPLDDPVRAAAEVMDLLESEPERLRASRSATERFHRDFDADNVAPSLFHFVMGITPPARDNEAAAKPVSL